ncbi:TrkH-domain-containing protein [Microthyrium microscopicum]|uniref:Potassium transport protein n=1 Tax=Microthyrium microscopicum TaxID=703497 RepID=A0A6A6U8E3_9PEZI|nr:TrkH-domain-containing protein [Microthyrium microscopicum]
MFLFNLPFRRWSRIAKAQLPQLNFITLHYLYFIVTGLVSGLIFWGSSTPSRSIPFADALFLCISAMTEAGLNTVNLSTLNTWQQIILFLLIMMGSSIFVSISVVHVRRKAFEERFLTEVQKRKRMGTRIRRTFSRARSASISRGPTHANKDEDRIEETSSETNGDQGPSEMNNHLAISDSSSPNPAIDYTQTQKPLSSHGTKEATSLPRDDPAVSSPPVSQFAGPVAMSRGAVINDALSTTPVSDHIAFSDDTRFRDTRSHKSVHRRLFDMSGVGAQPHRGFRDSTPNLPTQRGHRFSVALPSNDVESQHRIRGLGEVGRNSTFHHLDFAERERLGGAEYKAVLFLSWLIPIYFVGLQLLGCLSMGAYTSVYYSSLTKSNGLNPWWVGAFNAVSAFNNCGMSLLDANMVAFNKDVFILLSLGFLILAGFTCFPIFLRLVIWTLHKILPRDDKWAARRDTLQFLLIHPRRCFTHLFPSQHTWWLFWSVVGLDGIDCIMFVILNIGNNRITRLKAGYEVLDGLFQALAVRAGGFYVVSIVDTRIALQVLYVVMMYISAYPITISIRNSNVYEERSLGIYADEPGDQESGQAEKPVSWLETEVLGPANASSRRYFVQQQLRAQLAHDLWWLALAIFLIMIVEGSSFLSDPATFSVFNVVFETVSAYGTVGISVGVPNAAYSFCGAWHKLSKLILIAVMLRGRHRGLPVAIDKAVLLPRDHLNTLEDEDARIRREGTSATVLPSPTA